MSALTLSYLYFFNITVCLFLSFYIFRRNRHSWVNRFCAAFLFCYFGWNAGMWVSVLPDISAGTYKLLINLTSYGWIWFSPFLLMFSIFFTNRRNLIESKWVYYLAFFPALLFSLLQWSGKIFYGYEYIDGSLALKWSYNYYFFFYISYCLLLPALAFFIIFSYRRKTRLHIKKKQADIIMISGFVALIVSSYTNIIAPILGVSQSTIYGDMSILVWAAGLVYSMVRYKFLDVTPALAAQNVIETMSEFMILVDMRGRIKSINQSALEMLKYSKNEIEGQDVEMLFTKKGYIESVFEAVKQNKTIRNDKVNFRTKEKQGIPAYLSMTVLRDEMGDAVGLSLVARDIIEEKKVQDELRQTVKELRQSQKSISEAYNDLSLLEKQLEGEHNRIAAIFANFSDPIIFLNNDNRLMLINPEAKKMFDIREEAINEKIDKSGNFALENFSKIINRQYVVKRGAEAHFAVEKEEEMEVDINEQKMVFKVITRDVVDRGYFIGTMKIFTNLTREKEIDKLKSEFITIAAHQLRTPLTAIKWVIKTVMSGEAGPVNEEQKQYLNKGYDSNERIINLVNDMLDVSRIEEGRFGYNFAKENFLQTLQEVVDNLRPQIDMKKLNFETKLPKEVPLLTLDKAKITLVLQNLLENAVKYTPNAGKVTIEVKIDAKQLKVSVKDSGVGIPAEDQKKIFSKFFRAQNVMRMETEGSGLGLFIVRNVISKHGGSIGFKSQEGKGTEFFFELPINNNLK